MIKLENVSKKYGEFYAVKKLNLEIKEGEIVGFLGRNGAGKSTTMNMITGFIEQTEGKIIVGGYDIDYQPRKAKALIGYMPEGVPLYTDLTVKEFISYMADLKLVKGANKKNAVEKALNETGLDIVKNKLIRNLSRGFKQRVSLAGALVGDPKILILDEPTVGLDPEQVIEIRELIKSFRKNHTVILSSHILSEVSQICEKVVIIDKGEILAVDTPENLENNADKSEDVQLSVIVEDPDNKFMELKNKITEIKEIAFQKEFDDGTKQYAILVNGNNDIRKLVSISATSLNMIILEMKKEEKTLEDAFIKIIEDRPELTQKEREKIDQKMELEELREEAKKKKENKKQNSKDEKDSIDGDTKTVEEKTDVEENIDEDSSKTEPETDSKNEVEGESTENDISEENKEVSDLNTDNSEKNDNNDDDSKGGEE